MHRLLREDAYNGTFYHYRRKIVNGKLTRNLNKEEWRGVPVPRIVEQDLFETAQRKLTEGRKISARGVKYEYLVGRRITCECGYVMRSTTTPRTFHRQKGTSTTYYYSNYRCPGRHSMRVNSACTMKPIKTSTVDERTWEWVKEEIANPAVLERKLREIQSQQRDKNGGKAEVVASLERNKAGLEEELKRLATLYAKRAMPEHLLDELIEQENHKLHLTIAEIERVSQELSTPLTDETIDSLVAFSNDFAEHLEAVEQSFTGRRTVIDGLDVRVQVVRINDVLHLRLKSILRPDGVLRTLFASS
ncbi:MAG: recombinase family protein [Roseiflexaceae bacterium]